MNKVMGRHLWQIEIGDRRRRNENVAWHGVGRLGELEDA